MRFFIFTISFFFLGQLFAQDVCYESLIEKSFLVNFEGLFVNNQKSRSHIDIIWKHHESAPDSFQVYLSGQRSFLFITTPDYRLIWIQPENVKRQMATHHLRETIGNSPLHWDDLDLLANGAFFCQDSSTKTKRVFATAFSQTWYSIIVDSLPSPSLLKMRGAKRASRDIIIHSWKEFSGVLLTAILELKGNDYSGSLWVRSAYPIKKNPEGDPLLQKLKGKKRKINPLLFRGSGKERKTPLILQMDNELLY